MSGFASRNRRSIRLADAEGEVAGETFVIVAIRVDLRQLINSDTAALRAKHVTIHGRTHRKRATESWCGRDVSSTGVTEEMP